MKADNSLSVAGLGADVGYRLRVAPRLDISLQLASGYQYYILNRPDMAPAGATTSQGGGYAGLRAGLDYILGESWDLGLASTYQYDFGVAHHLGIALSASYHLGNSTTRLQRLDEAHGGQGRTPAPGEGIRIDRLDLANVFPVFHKYYDDHPLGTAVLYNQEDTEITNLELGFFVKQYMDNPKLCPVAPLLGPKEMTTVELLALFNDTILSNTEATKVTAEVELRYRLKGRLYADKRSATLRIHDRNAMTWDDDRRAAAFVTAKDPTILELSKEVAGVVRGSPRQPISEAFLKALAFHETLDLIGIQYVVDPQTPYADLSRTTDAIDFLQFPRQTLRYSAGDCDDLSILYCALLESVGVETAFITVPGHIYAAFAPGLSLQQAAACFSQAEEYLVLDGRVWIPVEVTSRGMGFLQAWEQGTRQWQEHAAKGQARLYPIHAAWEVYEPVGLPGEQEDAPDPGAEHVRAAFERALGQFIEREIRPAVERLERQIRASQGSPRHHNALGVLYARYGMLQEAARQFEAAARTGGYAPALVNLGNLRFLERDWNAALGYYRDAARLAPEDLKIQISVARACHELGMYDEAGRIHGRVRERDAALADQFAYLGTSLRDGKRAGQSGRQGELLWVD
ncbi:MAG: hypothetical protein JW820_15975 [Spirochaetales bacterium]|nr:hypothetical protein [Spirochaetales bacterium]